MSKLGFRFAAVPKDRHPEWFEVSLLARTIGLELFATIYDEKTRSAEVAVAEAWTVSLCRLMRVEARERLAACRALESLERHGLLVIENGKASLVFRADQELGKSTSSNPQEDAKTPSREVQEQVKRSPTAGNDSTPVPQKDKKEEIRLEEREAPAPDGPTPFRIGHDLIRDAIGNQYGNEWRRELESIGVKPEGERRAVQAAISRDPWCKANKTSVNPTHVLKHWAKYAAGNPPLKSVVRAAVGGKYAGPSRVATAEEYADQGEDPW